jgi:hypothetical protein
MKQHEAVIEAMRANGGYATLGHLYREALKVPDVEWRTKTPFASIRRIVQIRPEFFRIKPGLWALEEAKDKLSFSEEAGGVETRAEPAFDHSYYQGLLVEIGNLRGWQTFVPNQDKNRRFLNQPLRELTSVSDVYRFSYDNLVRRAQTIDVIWFNERNMPNSFFEVEHSTDVYNSLLKFVDLQDFAASFFIVAPEERQREFEARLTGTAFAPIKTRVKFEKYEDVSRAHTSLNELAVRNSSLWQSLFAN